MELLKLLSANELIAQGLSFLILLAVLRVFLWKRVLKILDDRSARIAARLKAIEDEKTASAAIRAEYETRLSRIEDEARLKIEEAINEGRRIADEVRRQGERDVQKMIDNGKMTITSELARAREELRDTVVDLVIETAEKIIEEKLTPDDDKRLVRDFLNRLEKEP